VITDHGTGIGETSAKGAGPSGFKVRGANSTADDLPHNLPPIRETKPVWEYIDLEEYNLREIAKLFEEGYSTSVIAHMFQERINPAIVGAYRDKAVALGILDPKVIQMGDKQSKRGAWANKYAGYQGKDEDGYAKPNVRRKKEQKKALKKALKEQGKTGAGASVKKNTIRVAKNPMETKEIVEYKMALSKLKARITLYNNGAKGIMKIVNNLSPEDYDKFMEIVNYYNDKNKIGEEQLELFRTIEWRKDDLPILSGKL
jgi:hypothetical protein